MKKLILSLFLAVALVVIPVGSAFADTSQDVTVTATPSYIVITNSPSTWTINDLGSGSENGKGKIKPSTTYYANPVDGADDTTPPSATVLAAECNFTADTTGSTVNTTLTVTWGDFSGGSDNMTNGDTGSAGATSYGAYCWYEGMTYSGKVLVKSTGSDAMVTNHAAGTLKWGVEIATQTNAWTGSTASTSTLTITATQT